MRLIVIIFKRIMTKIWSMIIIMIRIHWNHHHDHDDYNDTLYRDCQRQEWKVHKLLHKEISHTKDILDKNANESEERDEDIVF